MGGARGQNRGKESWHPHGGQGTVGGGTTRTRGVCGPLREGWKIGEEEIKKEETLSKVHCKKKLKCVLGYEVSPAEQKANGGYRTPPLGMQRNFEGEKCNLVR